MCSQQGNFFFFFFDSWEKETQILCDIMFRDRSFVMFATGGEKRFVCQKSLKCLFIIQIKTKKWPRNKLMSKKKVYITRDYGKKNSGTVQGNFGM